MALRKRGGGGVTFLKFASERGGTQKGGGSLRKGGEGSNPGGNCFFLGYNKIDKKQKISALDIAESQ